MLTKGAILKTRISIPIILCGIILSWRFQAFGKDWTETQKEAWSVIETRWEKLKQGDSKQLRPLRTMAL